ncbi:MAG: hypothetical protein Q8927_11955 [Bacteroidota bacterium]|nr:hypothetical protein [Bacteroidota bacterium]
MERVAGIPTARLHTSMKASFGCAIGMVSVEGRKAIDLENFLLEKYRIHTVAINWENMHGLRVTPNVYTSLKDLDLLVKGIGEFARS